MSDLFSSDANAAQGPVPLAERLRPKTVEEVIGQAQLLAPEAPLGGDACLRTVDVVDFLGAAWRGKNHISPVAGRSYGSFL